MKIKNIIVVGSLLVIGYYLYKVLKPTPMVMPPQPQPQPPQPPKEIKKDKVLNTPITTTTKYPIGQTPLEETKKLYPDAFKGSVLVTQSDDGKTTSYGTSGLLQKMQTYPSSSYSKLDPRIPNYR